MDIDAFEIAKAGQQSTYLDWAREMKIVSYGVVREVHDDVNVRCAFTVQQSSLAEQLVDVSLLSLSSKLFSMSITPLVGDQVLIFGLNAWSDKVVTGGTEEVDNVRQGYNGQTCVGILLRTIKMGSAFCASVSGTEENPVLDLTLDGQASFMSVNDLSVALTSPDGKNHPINVDIMENRPYTLRMMSAQSKTFGNSITLTIGKSADGKTVPASVSIDLDAQSDITLTSKSGASVSLDKNFNLKVNGAVNIEVGGNTSIKAGGNVDVEAGGNVNVTAGGQCEIKSASGLTLNSGDAQPWRPSVVPVCPFGMSHGGAIAGIVKLKGK